MLFMSSSATPVTNVVYQKIVPPVGDVPPALFLAQLVEYLQDHFTLPSNLPMVYEAISADDTSSQTVLSWDSPLSSFPEATKLSLEVVGIFTDDDSSSSAEGQSSSIQSVPKMAMVVVSKASTDSVDKVAPMMKGLFEDSEKRILRALDRGLEDFSTGKIKMSSTNVPPSNFKNAEEAIQAELMEEMTNKSLESTSPEDIVIETTSTDMSETTNSQEEYAVQAAKRAASLRNSNSPSMPSGDAENIKEDFAVQAAKRIAAQRQRNGKKNETNQQSTQNRKKITPKRRSFGPRFRTTISSPKNRAERKAAVSTRKAEKSQKSRIRPVKPDPTASLNARNVESTKKSAAFEDRPSSETDSSETLSTVPDVKTKRKVNVRVVQDENSDMMDVEQQPFQQIVEMERNDRPPSPKKKKSKSSKPKRTVSREQMERDVAEATQKVMAELASDGNDMTPQELLDDVIQFGKEKDKENAVGQGFVSGAFEKAKELMRERKHVMEARRRKSVQFKEVNRNVGSFRPGIADPPELESSKNGELTAEEELKRIFQAGERLAEGRISTTSSKEGSEITRGKTGETTEQDIDELIASDKTISSHARILDEELAELEVRINKSPGEDMDGPRKNPIFDIFSGPEVYNPNVDPETAVNWPGAQPGSKEIRLPKELDEAVRQAKFATDILTRMREVEKDGKGGDNTTQYFLGDKELTQEQVDNLRHCVEEATQIGLIEDPLELMAERSRLQMVLDELTGQPEERIQDIASNYKDLLLSDNFVSLITERLEAMADRDLAAMKLNDTSLEGPHALERELLGHLVVYAQLLLKEARALGAELEAAQLEVVRSICEVAMDPSHATEEETSIALTDAVRDMRPMLDDSFVAYLKYAVAEEEGRLARAGLLDDPAHNDWLFVLKIVQQGVYNEIATGINRFIDHIWYVLRMESKEERRALLKKFIDVMPTLDVRPFVQVVDNIVGSLGDSVRGEFDAMVLGEMTNKLLQLHRDVHELLPPERIKLMSRDADEWAAQQRQRLMEQRKITKQRLKAAQDTQYYDEEVRRRGEVERMT